MKTMQMHKIIFAAILLAPVSAFAQAVQQPNPMQAALQELGTEHAYDVATIAQLQAQVTQLRQQLVTAEAKAPKAAAKPTPKR